MREGPHSGLPSPIQEAPKVTQSPLEASDELSLNQEADLQPTPDVIEFPIQWVLISVLTFAVGVLVGFILWGNTGAGTRALSAAISQEELVDIARQVNPPQGWSLPVEVGDLGPQLVAGGAIDLESFTQIYQDAGTPLSEDQMRILTVGSDEDLTINKGNARFWLNFFWALGLANQNPVLTEGLMMQYGEEQVGQFASTGGWTLGAKPATELYASLPLVRLTSAQQERLERVAANVFRPCCNNPTHFPDCNHGMAMLGLLELMAAQGASEREMYEAAKYANAFWFSQQTFEIALYFYVNDGLDFDEVDPQLVVGERYSSGTGFQGVHSWLVENNLLDSGSGGGGSSCGA